uniref:DUF4766 domain-containing protein n=1 Tax=Clastoptera arizonana TaxID=38151 RepID=A0A1B6DB61_9HEMI
MMKAHLFLFVFSTFTLYAFGAPQGFVETLNDGKGGVSTVQAFGGNGGPNGVAVVSSGGNSPPPFTGYNFSPAPAFNANGFFGKIMGDPMKLFQQGAQKGGATVVASGGNGGGFTAFSTSVSSYCYSFIKH